MKRNINRLVSFVLALSLILSLFTMVSAAPSATDVVTTPTGYTSASDVVYKTVNGYIANWGARGEDCTFLSTYAQEFYTTGYTYDELSALDGGTSASTAAGSALYAKLNTLISSAHKYQTSYGGSSASSAKNYLLYTDCVNSDTSKVSLIYMGSMVDSTWNGSTYNQEHVWPKSNLSGDTAPDSGDIMHIRAANVSENSSRGNKSYGLGSGSYDPGVSVRGDVARMILYMFVRWGNTSTLFGTGTTGAFESLDTLLAWNAEDPVDTWEMGRNDAVQSITGTRNVFVDYPELAYDLFNEEIPADMTTPSGSQEESTGGLATLVTDASSLKVNDKIILVATGYDYALSTTQNGNNRAAVAITKSGNSVAYGEDTQVITLIEGTVSGSFGFQVGEQYLYAASSSSNYLRSSSKMDDNSSWAITIADGTANIVAQGTNTRNILKYNNSSKIFACYSTGQQAIAVYKVEGKHEHAYDEGVVTAPTCTENGYTTYSCECGFYYTDNEVEATGHKYVDGICSCGEVEPTTATATLVTDRGQLSVGTQIIIVAAGEYNVALSTTQNSNNRGQADIVKDGNTVTFGEDVQIITLEAGLVDNTLAFKVEGGYLYAASSTSNHLKTQEKLNENGSWLITFDNGVPAIVAQGSNSHNILRYNSQNGIFSCYGSGQLDVSIYILPSDSSHTHEYDSVVTAPTCTAQGYTTHTCECGSTYQDTFVEMLDHDYVDGVCTGCGKEDPTASSDPTGYYLVTDISQITEGGQFVVVANGKAMNTTISSGKFVGVDVIVSGNKVVGDNLPVWTVEAVSGGVAFNYNGKYLAYNSSTNFKMDSASYTWTVVAGESGYVFDSSKTTRGIYFQLASSKFGAYAQSNANNDGYVSQLQLYKYVEAQTECVHSYVESVVAATCENDGLKTFTCSKCGDTYTEVIPALGHKHATVVTAPTCEDEGYTTYTCACGDSYVADYVDALGHSYANGVCGTCGGKDPSYVPVVVPTITLKTPTLLLEDTIKLNIYYTIDQDIPLEKMGMITWKEKPSVVDISTADAVYPGATFNEGNGQYGVNTDGIPAQDLGDIIYFCIYAELADGSIAYGKQVQYSPTTYAYNQLRGGATPEMKALLVAILNYGAAAQTYLEDTDPLVTSDMTDEMKALIEEYRADMVHSVAMPSASKQGAMAANGGFSAKKPTIALDGAFSINYYFTPSKAVAGDMTFYYWNAADFEAAEVLTAENATGSYAMTEENGAYGAAIQGIAAKDIDSALYACGVYTDASGYTYSTGILPYSLGFYCGNQAKGEGALADLASAIAVYGYYAGIYFAK